jgi:hypothetical protein
LNDLLRRLRLNRQWVGAQFGWVLAWIWVGVATLHFPGIQRWPEWLSGGLRVTYSSLIMIAALAVQTGMLRSLIRSDARRVRHVWGALALLLWFAVGCVGLAIALAKGASSDVCLALVAKRSPYERLRYRQNCTSTI